MDFSELRTELLARGFDDLSPTRAGQMVNRGMRQLDGHALWPYREESVTGTAPLAIADLGTVEVVLNMDTGTELTPADYRNLIADYQDLSQDGEPLFWYRATPNGVPTVAVYPESTATIGVQYFRVTADLVADGDEPAAPERWHDVIIDLAVIRAYRDADNHQAAESLQAQVDRDLAQMREELFGTQIQGPGFIQMRDGSCDS